MVSVCCNLEQVSGAKFGQSRDLGHDCSSLSTLAALKSTCSHSPLDRAACQNCRAGCSATAFQPTHIALFSAKPFYAEIDTALDQIPLDHRSFQFRHLHVINFQFRKKNDHERIVYCDCGFVHKRCIMKKIKYQSISVLKTPQHRRSSDLS